MENQIKWTKYCENIAANLADDVIGKFVNNEEINLNMIGSIKPGDVYGLLSKTPLNDEWDTVIVKYSVIPRSEISLANERLYKSALKGALHTANHLDWLKVTDFEEYYRNISENAEWEVGKELQNIFSEIAIANPDKYPIKVTHGHAVRKIDHPQMIKIRNFENINL